MQRSPARRARRTAAVGLVGALAVAGCASGGSRDGGASSTSSTSAVAPTTARAPNSQTCTPARPAPATSSPLHFSFRGTDRTYLLRVPPHYDGEQAMPAIFSLPGFGATAQAHEVNTAMGRTGTARGFIVVTPSALGSPAAWNIFGAKDQADDFAFIHALVVYIERRLCVDHARVFAAGYSNGSAFAGFLTCTSPYEFAAVAMVEATTPAACPRGVTPSVLAIAGTADPAVLYNGGTGASNSYIPSAPKTIEGYAQRYGCDVTPSNTELIPGVEQTRYGGCDGGAEVALDTIVGGTHDYAGGLVAAHDHTDSPAGQKFGATRAVVDFFSRHHRSW